MKRARPLIYLYAAAAMLAVWPDAGPFVRFLSGGAGLVAVWLTLGAIDRVGKTAQASSELLRFLAGELRDLQGQLEAAPSRNERATSDGRPEELAERLAGIELRLAALEQVEAKVGTHERGAYAGWPRRVSLKRSQDVTHTGVCVDDRFIEIADVLYPIESSDKIYCAECYRSGKQKLNEISLRPDGSAYFCDECDTWIPTDPHDQAARVRAQEAALQSMKAAPNPS